MWGKCDAKIKIDPGRKILVHPLTQKPVFKSNVSYPAGKEHPVLRAENNKEVREDLLVGVLWWTRAERAIACCHLETLPGMVGINLQIYYKSRIVGYE